MSSIVEFTLTSNGGRLDTRSYDVAMLDSKLRLRRTQLTF